MLVLRLHLRGCNMSPSLSTCSLGRLVRTTSPACGLCNDDTQRGVAPQPAAVAQAWQLELLQIWQQLRAAPWHSQKLAAELQGADLQVRGEGDAAAVKEVINLQVPQGAAAAEVVPRAEDGLIVEEPVAGQPECVQ